MVGSIVVIVGKVLLWIFNVYTAFGLTEIAALSWCESGVPMLYTLVTLLVTSTVFLYLTFSGFTVLNWILKKVLHRDPGAALAEKAERYAMETQNSWKRKIVGWTVNTIRKMSTHRYIFLFVFNLVPFPLFSTGTIVAAKLFKIKWGIIPILVANGVKVSFVVTFVYFLFSS